MISRPYKAYYVNNAGKDCGWFGEKCNVGEDLGMFFAPKPQQEPPLKPVKTNTPTKTYQFDFKTSTNTPVASKASGSGKAPTLKASGTASNKTGVGGDAKIDVSPDKKDGVGDLLDQVEKAGIDIGMPPGLTLPMMMIGGVIVLILVMKR